MKKVFFGVVGAILLSLAMVGLAPAQEAYACYDGGFTGGGFGPNGFSLMFEGPDTDGDGIADGSGLGEAAVFTSQMQLKDDALQLEYEADSFGYVVKYAGIFGAIAKELRFHGGSGDDTGGPVYAFDGVVRSKYIQGVVLGFFERC